MAGDGMTTLEVEQLIVAAFFEDHHRLDASVIPALASYVCRGQLQLADAVRSVAEMLELPVPDVGDHRSAGRSNEKQQQQPQQRHAPPPAAAVPGGRVNITHLRNAAQQRVAAAANHQHHGHENGAAVVGGGRVVAAGRPLGSAAASSSAASGLIVESLLEEGEYFAIAFRSRLDLARRLRVAWHQQVRECLRIALTACKKEADGPAAVADFLRELGSKQRMKEKIGVEHLPLLLEVVSAALSATSSPYQVEACVDATRAMHSRFGTRINELLRNGGPVDAGNAAREAREQFQVLKMQLRHHPAATAAASRDVGGAAADLGMKIVELERVL